MDKIDLRNFSYEELVEYTIDHLGEKSYRAKQIFEWIYLRNVDSFDEMTNLSKELRTTLDEQCTIKPLQLTAVHKSKDGAEKLQFTLNDGKAIEAVLMPSEGRTSLCISSQVGCQMGCRFCFTGSLKLARNLTTSEIVDQYRQAVKHFDGGDERISNVVLMGMGEPLMNLDNVVRACNLLMHEWSYNLSGRKVTVSTCGVVPRILELATRTNVNLAISMNATTNKSRSEIMPINDKYPIEELVDVLDKFPAPRRKRIFLEYIMLKDVNDTFGDAHRLGKIAKRLKCKVNLIAYNAHEAGDPFSPPTYAEILVFQKFLIDFGVETFIRQSRGQDIYGACGMLGKTE